MSIRGGRAKLINKFRHLRVSKKPLFNRIKLWLYQLRSRRTTLAILAYLFMLLETYTQTIRHSRGNFILPHFL